MTRERWAIPIQGDATRADSAAVTPSPDAEGKIRLRDPGLGIGDVGDPAFTVSATSPGIVASGPTEQEGGDALPLTHASFFSGVGGLQSTLGLNVLDGEPSPSPRSTPTPAPSSGNGGPASPTSAISSLSPAIQPGAKGWRGMRGDGSDPIVMNETGRGWWNDESEGTPAAIRAQGGKQDSTVVAFPVTYSGRDPVLRTENQMAITGPPPPSGAAASRARISASPGSGGASTPTPSTPTTTPTTAPTSPSRSEPAPASPSPSSTLWPDTDPRLSSWRTSLASSPVMEGETWRRSSVRWSNSGMAWRTGCSTLATSECPSADGESSSLACEAIPTTLTDVLQPSAPPRFSLSARAAAGILRRASKRGRALPTELESALTSLAQSSGHPGSATTTTPTPSSSVRRLTPTETELLMGWEPGHTIVHNWKRGR
jgi:hypothetical protein